MFNAWNQATEYDDKEPNLESNPEAVTTAPVVTVRASHRTRYSAGPASDTVFPERRKLYAASNIDSVTSTTND
jgi:hypothetical protein